MRKTSAILISLYISMLFSFSVQGKETAEFKKIHSQAKLTIVLVNKNTTKSQLYKYGKNNCSGKTFCVIWYFDDNKKAQTGIKRAKAGNLYDPIPGLISIYSKNKMVNKIICHEPKGTC